MQKRFVFLIVLLAPCVSAQDVPKAISVEPIGIAPGEASTLVVHGLSLTDSTSLWTNLPAQVSRLGAGESSGSQEVRSAFSDSKKPPAGTIILEAEEYHRGTWGKRPPFILNIGGGNANVAEWDVDCEAAGNFVLEFNYASGGERPVRLSLNGQELTDKAAVTQTGGFGPGDTKWIPECVVALRAGKNTIRMECVGGTPHFDQLALVPTELPVTLTAAVEPTDRLAPWRIDVPTNTAVGIYGLRIATRTGISNLQMFMVDDLPTVREIRGATSSVEGQLIRLPVAVEGYCDSTHADRYSFDVSAGQELSVEAVAQRLGTSLDPVISLFDGTGRELAFADDSPGLSGDCRIHYRFKAAGSYSITISDSLTGGSSSYRYRLRLGNFPLLTTPVPAAVQVGDTAEVALAGIGSQQSKLNVTAEAGASVIPVSASSEQQQGSGFTRLAVSSHPQSVTDAETVCDVSVPSGISGVFAQPDEVHRCRIELKKEQKIRLRDGSRSNGVPTVVALSIHDESGQQLAAMRKAGPGGQTLSWASPADGQYELRFAELTGRGGPEFGYHVQLMEDRPDFELSVETDHAIVPQNGYAILKVTVKRRGFNGPVKLAVFGAEDGIHLRNEVIAEKAKETRLKVELPPKMKPGQTRGIEIWGTANIDGQPVDRVARTLAAFRKARPQTTFPPPGLDGLVALSVGPEIPDFFGLSLDGGEILFPRLVGEVYFTVRVKDRIKGFKDMVNITILDLPDGFSAGGGERAVSRSDNNEYRFQLRGPTQTEKTTQMVRIVGEASYRGQTKEFELERVPFRVIDPLIVSAIPSVPFEPGSEGQLTVKARRFVPRAGGDKAAITVELSEVPDGVTLPRQVTIPAGQDQIKVPFSVAADAKPVRVSLTARTIVAGQPVEVTGHVGGKP